MEWINSEFDFKECKYNWKNITSWKFNVKWFFLFDLIIWKDVNGNKMVLMILNLINLILEDSRMFVTNKRKEYFLKVNEWKENNFTLIGVEINA